MPDTPESQLNVAVLMGGVGDERDVSLQSGRCVADALQTVGVNVTTSDIRPDYLDILDKTEIDVFFIALHGQFGEDGRLQQILEDRGLCYTGSGPQASALAFDKMASKEAFCSHGVDTPAWLQFNDDTDPAVFAEELAQWPGRYVVKPVRQGSSVGVMIVEGADKALDTAKDIYARFGDCMVEQFVAGREITVGVLNGAALPIIEIRSKADFYDYNAKYVDDATEYLFDTITDAELIARVNDSAVKCFDALACRHFARADFIIGPDNVPYALEVNTIPGFTTHSLLPKAAEKVGLPMGPLCLEIINAAIAEKRTCQSAVNKV